MHDDLTFLSIYFKDEGPAPYQLVTGFVEEGVRFDKVIYHGWQKAETDQIFNKHAVYGPAPFFDPHLACCSLVN